MAIVALPNTNSENPLMALIIIRVRKPACGINRYMGVRKEDEDCHYVWHMAIMVGARVKREH